MGQDEMRTETRTSSEKQEMMMIVYPKAKTPGILKRKTFSVYPDIQYVPGRSSHSPYVLPSTCSSASSASINSLPFGGKREKIRTLAAIMARIWNPCQFHVVIRKKHHAINSPHCNKMSNEASRPLPRQQTQIQRNPASPTCQCSQRASRHSTHQPFVKASTSPS